MDDCDLNNDPRHFDMLSEDDKVSYKSLQKDLSSKARRNHRNHRVDIFNNMLTTIQDFCQRNLPDDGVRHFVCGVCQLPGAIAVNARQLGVLIGRCKASINGSFQRLGCRVFPKNNNMLDTLKERIPLLRDNYQDLREWSVRIIGPETPQPHIPKLDKFIADEPKPHTPVPSLPTWTECDSNLCSGAADDSQYDMFCLEPDFLYEW